MREMNPLDLLAEVAVSCTDDKKNNTAQHSEGFIEPKAELCKLEAVQKMTYDNNNLTVSKVTSSKNHIHGEAQTQVTGVNSEEPTNAVDVSNTELNMEPSQNVETEALQKGNVGETRININGVNIIALNASKLDSNPPTNTAVPPGNSSPAVEELRTDQLAACSKSALKPDSVNVEKLVRGSSPVPSGQTVSQQVSRLLFPNFKLTMTDNVPSILQSRKVSSLLIGNLGSATIRSALAPNKVVHQSPALVKPKTVLRKSPNISITAIPYDFPLLDHDYCYQNYCDIVQASAKLVKEQHAAKKLTQKQLKLEQKTKEASGADEKPIKKKYRTKKVIAQELEVERRLSLERKANEGDENALDELDRIQQLELELQQREINKQKKKLSKKRNSSETVEVEIDSDEEAEVAEDIAGTNPVINHKQELKDQFNSKKHKRQNMNKVEDPNQHLWKTRVVKNDGSNMQQVTQNTHMPCSTSHLSMEGSSVLSPNLMLNTSQEMNDVFDVLGLSSVESVDSTERWCDVATDMDTKLFGDPSDRQVNLDVIDNGESAVAGLDDLLQDITMDQVSELILALDVDSGLHTGDLGEPHQVFDCGSPKEMELSQPGIEDVVKSLSTLAKEVCCANNIKITSRESENTSDGSDNLSQQSQTSNISLDFTDADILASDKTINFDLINELGATPPKAIRPNNLLSSQLSSPVKKDSTNTQSPVVVPVTMYWNTFPALLLEGVKYVRLIDISRQALPSKETGLLKKRAQALGYEVTNCTDLQRNLLVRYAFACQSRSTLMVTEACAAEVIASYMEKSEIEELSKAPELPLEQLLAHSKSTTTASVRAPAEPVTLMPQVLIEHKPLQQSSLGNTKSPSATLEPVAPERSSRLRQIKSSYRRFLSLGSTPTAGPTNSGCAAGTEATSCAFTEENASDRGYHSDQSPDSLSERPLHAKPRKDRKMKAGRQNSKASARKGFSTSQDAVKSSISEVGEKQSVDDDSALAPTPTASPSATATASEDVTDFNSQSRGDVLTPDLVLDSIEQSEVVHIRHIDLIPRRNTATLSQDGDLFLKYFKSLHSICIRCCTCNNFFTLKAFTKHQHVNQKLVPVKVRQRIEAIGVSVDSEYWQMFKKRKQLFETKRAPLQKISETRLSKSDAKPDTGLSTSASVKQFPLELGKRIPKQKKYNPDEMYYTNNPCILSTSRKRKAESNSNNSWKRKSSSDLGSLKRRVER